MKAAEFELGINAKTALATLTQVKREVHNLSHTFNSELKGAVMGAVGIAAIEEAIRGTIEYADAIAKASNRMSIATDNLQALKLAARDAGKDLGFVETAFQKLEKAASKGLKGGAAGKAFENLGISKDDLQHLNKVPLFTRTIAAASASPTGEANLAAIFGPKMGGSLLAMNKKGQLSDFEGFKADKKASGAIASDEDIQMLAQIKDRWEEIIDVVRAHLIPGLAGFLDWLADFVRGVIQITELIGTTIGALVGSISKFDIGGLVTSFGQGLYNGMAAVFKNFWDVITGKVSFSEAFEKVGKSINDAVDNTLKEGFGIDKDAVAQTIQEQLSEAAEEDRKVAQKRAEKLAEFKKNNDDKNAPANRVAPVTADKKAKETKLEALKGDEGIKIGDLMNADTKYRVERVQFQMARSMEEVADNTERTADVLEEILDNMDEGGFAAGS